MQYKINFIRGFKFSFTDIASIFSVLSTATVETEKIVNATGYNESRTQILLSFLSECGLIEKRGYNLTRIGEVIYTYDKYLEQRETLWLIHYLLATKEHLAIWNRLFNEALDEDYRDRETLLKYFGDLKKQVSDYTFERNVRKEIKMTLDTYVQERFLVLDLIDKSGESYCCNRNGNIPELIFLSSVVYFKNKYFPGATAINIKDICYLNNSPGRILFLDEACIRQKLERLKNQGLIGLESQADLDQLRLGDGLTVDQIMEKYYKGI